MDDDIVAALLAWPAGGGGSGVRLDVAVLEYGGNASTEGAALQPATVGQGRVVGRRRSQVPLFVGGIETVAVPASRQRAVVSLGSETGRGGARQGGTPKPEGARSLPDEEDVGRWTTHGAGSSLASSVLRAGLVA